MKPRLAALVSLLVIACAPRGEASPSREERPAKHAVTPRDAYKGRLASLSLQRDELGKRYAEAKTKKAKRDVLDAARDTLMQAIVDDVFPAWAGTAWDFNGTTTTPGEGKIACGYFVTTVLRDTGFDVERARLAQQPSERIVKTLAPSDDIWRFRKGKVSLVLDKVRSEGEGLYVVGLDNHVGFLLEKRGEKTQFCHSSYVDPPEVRCEGAEDAEAFVSNYHVVGRVFNATALVRWLEGSAFETVTE